MSAQSQVSQVCRLGRETTPGTLVPATYQPRDLSLSLKYKPELDKSVSSGDKLASGFDLVREMAEGSIEDGKPCYIGLMLILEALIGNGVHTEIEPGVWEHRYAALNGEADLLRTYTAAVGNASYARGASYLAFTGMGLNFDKKGGNAELSGDFIASNYRTNVILEARNDRQAKRRILPQHVQVYVDPTFETLGTTKLRELRSVEVKTSGRQDPEFYLDGTLSYDGLVEGMLDTEVMAKVNNNVAATVWIDRARQGTTVYVQLLAVGAVLEASALGTKNSFTMNLPTQVKDIGDTSPDGNTIVTAFSLSGVVDAEGYTGEYILVNDVEDLFAA